jgi:hypothetical protein
VTTPYDHEALWTKAKVFLNRAMDPGELRSFDEQALWASAALELLGKAALARVSPLLIAEPSEEGVNILIATGLIEGTAKFTSVRASTIFKRCQRAFRPFNAVEALKIANARNEYLHGSDLGFAPLTPEIWWPRFWALATILVTGQDRELDELVGAERSSTVEAYLEQNIKHVEHQTEALINRAKQRLAQYEAGTLPAKVQLEWNANVDFSAGLRYDAPQSCPACDEVGTLEGDEYTDATYEYSYDGTDFGESWMTLTIPSDHFSCSTCHLVLARYELIVEADLPSSFTAIDDNPDPEMDYGND